MGSSSSKRKEPAANPMPKGDMCIDMCKPTPPPIFSRLPPSQIVPKMQTVRYTRIPEYFEPAPTDYHRVQTSQVIASQTLPKSYEIWQSSYNGYKHEDLDLMNNRIANNATAKIKSNERDLRQIQHERIRAEAAIYNATQPPIHKMSLNNLYDQTKRFAKFPIFDNKYFSPKPARPELTADMRLVITNASIPTPPSENLVVIDGVQLTRKDIRTLTGLNWLNDEVINAYFFLIVERGKLPKFKKVYAFNTFFYPKVKESGYNSVKRWTRKVDIFSYDFLLVPVHLGNHWCLAVIDFMKRTITYYDSLGGLPYGCCDTLLDYLRFESLDKKKQDFDEENWRLINKYMDGGLPEQQNSSDCGVFACMYAEYITRLAKLNFTQKDMPYFRQKMIYELMTKKIIQ